MKRDLFFAPRWNLLDLLMSAVLHGCQLLYKLGLSQVGLAPDPYT